MKGRKSVLTLVIAAVIALSTLLMLVPVSAASTSTGSDVSPDYIKANSAYVAIVKLVTSPSSSSELRIVNLSFSGNGFDTSDLLPLNATGVSGVSIWKDSNSNGLFDGEPTDGKITLGVDPVWAGNNVTLQLTSGHNIGETFFIAIKTSSTISNNDVVNVTVTRLQEWNGTAYQDMTLSGVHTGEVTADTVPPTVPDGAITAPNGGENWAGTQTITWSGISDAHFGANPITIYYSSDGGSTWSTLVAATGNDGTHSWDTTAVADGSNYKINITATDEAGNYNYDISNATFTIDNTNPTVTIDVPVDGGYYNSLTNISGTASDATSGVASVTITIYNASDGKYWNGSAWVASAVQLSVTGTTSWYRNSGLPTWVDTKQYMVNATATDNAGNTGTDSNSFTYDTTEPDSQITVPANNGYYNSLTNITGTASDATSGVASVTITIYNASDGKYWNGSAWVASAVQLSVTGTTSWYRNSGLPTWVDTKQYIINSTATDNAGNVESTPDSNSFTYDTTDPTSSVDAITPYWKTSSPLTITATASDTTSGVASVTLYYRYSGDNSSWGGWVSFGTDSASPWSWNFTFSNGTGYYEFYSIATDNAGNTESAPGSADDDCGYDYTAPTVTISVPTNGGYYNSLTNITGAASDATSGVASVTITIYNASDGKYWNGSAWVASAVQLSVTGTTSWYRNSGLPTWVDTKQYMVNATATDNAGNTGTDSNSFTYDTTAPTSSVDAITPYWKNSSPLTVTATASDATSGVKNVTLYYRFSSDNSSWGGWVSFGTDSASPWSWNFTFSNGTGYYEFYSIATDNAGNTESAPGSADQDCGYDYTEPSSTVTIPTDGGYYNSLTNITGAASDATSGVASVTITIYNASDGKYWNGSAWVASAVQLSVTGTTSWYRNSGLPTWADTKQYIINSTATDNAGNVESTPDSNSFTYDTTEPNSEISVPVNNGQYETLTNITGSATDATSGVDHINITIYNSTDGKYWNGTGWQSGVAWLTTTRVGSGTSVTWYRNSLPTWVDGKTYIVNSTAVDVAGNVETSPDSNSFTLDDTPPSVSNVLITDTTISSTLYVKNGDSVSVTATITDSNLNAGDTGYLKADLTGFGLGAAVNATAYNGTVAWWNFTVVSCTPSDGTITVTINATDPAGNYNNTESDTITADNTAPTLDYAVFSPDYNGNTYSYIDVYFSENVDNSTIATTDFSIGVSGVTVTAFYNDGNTNKVTLKLSHKITGGGPTITISGDGIDDLAGNTISSGTITVNTYRISLSQGWNLISIPADVSSITIRTLLDSIWLNINMSTSILWYNASSDSWLTYIPSQQTGTLTSMEPGKAYWIKMNASDTLIGNYSTIPHGTNPAPIVELTGHRWNMIGHWVVYNQTADTSGGLSSLSDVLASSGEILYKYDTTSGGFVNIYASSTTNMEPGTGYWLWLKTTQTGYYTVGEQG